MDKLLSKIREKLSLKKTLPALTLSLLSSCSPSQESIQKMIDDVPQKQQHSLVINYDKSLLHNIDSLANSGHTLEDAIEKSHDITWDKALKSMPKKISEWTGENWIIKSEAQKQLEASRQTKTRMVMRPMPQRIGNVTSYRLTPMPEAYHIYQPEYRDQLENEIKTKETSLEKNKTNLKLDIASLKEMQQQNY